MAPSRPITRSMSARHSSSAASSIPTQEQQLQVLAQLILGPPPPPDPAHEQRLRHAQQLALQHFQTQCQQGKISFSDLKSYQAHLDQDVLDTTSAPPTDSDGHPRAYRVEWTDDLPYRHYYWEHDPKEQTIEDFFRDRDARQFPWYDSDEGYDSDNTTSPPLRMLRYS